MVDVVDKGIQSKIKEEKYDLNSKRTLQTIH